MGSLPRYRRFARFTRRYLKVECPVCHKDFTPIRIGQTRCSAACSVKWWNNIRHCYFRFRVK